MRSLMQQWNTTSATSARTVRTACSDVFFAVRFFAYCFFYYFSYYFQTRSYRRGIRAF